MKFQELKRKVPQMKNCLDGLKHKLGTVVVREVKTIQTEVPRKKKTGK